MKKLFGIVLVAALLLGGIGVATKKVNAAKDPGTGGLRVFAYDPGTGGLK